MSLLSRMSSTKLFTLFWNFWKTAFGAFHNRWAIYNKLKIHIKSSCFKVLSQNHTETQNGQKILKIRYSEQILRAIWLARSSGTPQKLSSLFWAKTDNLWIGAKKVENFFFKISMVPSIEQWVLFQKKSKSDQCFISIKSCWRGRSQEGTNPAIGLRAKRTGVGCSINNPTITYVVHSSHKKSYISNGPFGNLWPKAMWILLRKLVINWKPGKIACETFCPYWCAEHYKVQGRKLHLKKREWLWLKVCTKNHHGL